jgi:GT2 family glycosyltransferase
MTVSAVIPHWNRRELLEKLLASMRSQSRPFDETIVVDNGSTDGSPEFAESKGARVIRLDRNFGFAAAVNRGIENACGDWVAILNNDVTLGSNWLEILLDQAGDAGFATGKILSAFNANMVDGAFDEISRGACACRCGSGKPDAHFWNMRRTIRSAPMTAALFRRRLFEDVGPLDERFGSYLEDVDFGLRCGLRGISGAYIPDAVAFHVGSATQGAWNSDTVKLISRNQVFFALKHFGGVARWPIMAGQLLWGILALRHARGVAWLAGKIAGLRMAREFRGELGVNKEQRFRELLEASERSIFETQQQTGFDWYWRAYFCLLRR